MNIPPTTQSIDPRAGSHAKELLEQHPICYNEEVFCGTCADMALTRFADGYVERISKKPSPSVEDMLAVLSEPMRQHFLKLYIRNFKRRFTPILPPIARN